MTDSTIMRNQEVDHCGSFTRVAHLRRESVD